MGTVDPNMVTDLTIVTNLEGTKIVPTGPNAGVFITSNSARADAIRDALNNGLRYGRAYLRNEVPASLHYRNNPRVGNVVVLANSGAVMDTGTRPPVGMHGILLASEPDILKGQHI